MSKNLIIYFSHDKENYVTGQIKELEIGNTKVIAQKIRDRLNADIFEIIPLHEYPYQYKECTTLAKKEFKNNERPKVSNIISNIEEYDTIYLGYPNWWGTMPMCVWTFLETYDLSHKNIYPFCTHEGSGLGQSIEDIQRLCPQSYIKKGLAIYGSQVEISDQEIEKWLKEK